MGTLLIYYFKLTAAGRCLILGLAACISRQNGTDSRSVLLVIVAAAGVVGPGLPGDCKRKEELGCIARVAMKRDESVKNELHELLVIFAAGGVAGPGLPGYC